MSNDKNKEQQAKTEKKKIVIALILMLLASLFGLITSNPAIYHQNSNKLLHPMYKVEAIQTFYAINQDFPQLNFTDVANAVVETVLDLIWDVDGDSGFEGFLPLAFSYVPFLGSNGNVFTDIIFILSVTIGLIILSKKIRQARGG